MRFPLGSGQIHNDAHPGNLVPDPTSRHRYLLTDWEGACIGPRELDVVLVGAPGSRFGDPDHERLAFTRVYGYDIATWPEHQPLRDIRDLHSLAAYIRTGTRKPAALAQLRVKDRLAARRRPFRPMGGSLTRIRSPTEAGSCTDPDGFVLARFTPRSGVAPARTLADRTW